LRTWSISEIMVSANSLKGSKRSGGALSVVKRYAAIMGCAINAISISYARRSTDIAGKNNEKNLAGEIA